MVCIITFARSWQALVATRALGKLGIKVVTADTDKFATSFFSKYSVDNFLYRNPKDEKGFISDMIEKSRFYRKKYDEDVMILPIHNETFVISKYKKQLEKHVHLCVEDYQVLSRLHNKSRVPMILKKLNVRHPNTFVIRDVLKLYRLVPKLQFPVFLKLTETAASIGLEKINERDDLIYRYKEIVKKYDLTPKDYPIVQEGVAGEDYCVTAIYNDGKKRAMMTYKNIKCHPYKSGPGVYRKNVNIPKMEKEGTKLLNGVKWHGVVEMDFRMGPDNRPFFIEANPRFWGGLNQSVASNVNYPYLAYRIAMFGDCETVTKFTKGIRTENLSTAVMALFDEIMKDERKKKQLEQLSKHWKSAFKDKEDFKLHIANFYKTLRDINKKRYAFRAIEEFFRRRPKVKDDILDKDDPFVVMGVFYPLHLLMKYGKVNREMLTGENPKK